MLSTGSEPQSLLVFEFVVGIYDFPQSLHLKVSVPPCVAKCAAMAAGVLNEHRHTSQTNFRGFPP